MVVQMIGTLITLASAFNSNGFDIISLMRGFSILPALSIIISLGSFLWIWSIGSGLNELLPQSLKVNLKWLKASLLFPIFYLLLVSIAVSIFLNNAFDPGYKPNPVMILTTMGIIFPLHMLTMVCTFYSFYIAAKVFKTLESNKEVTLSDCLGEIVLIWFYPVGIWILQPKINNIIKSRDH